MRYSCLRNFKKCTENHGFGNHVFLTGFIRGFGGCDVAFVKKSVSSFVFCETMLIRKVLKGILASAILILY
jgi:hypothetical protein